MKANLAQREPEFLKRWDAMHLQDLIRSASKGKKPYLLHDGPPYANGHIHMGHALNKVLKDMVVKYKTMAGFDACYVPGWDCHGLPIELQALKELGKKKDEVDPVLFRKQARAYAEKFVGIQKKEFQRLGVMGEWDRPYLTMDYAYQAKIAECFLDLFEKGYIERRLKPVPWDYQSETALADAEIEYEEKVSQSVYAAFKLNPETEANRAFLEAMERLSGAEEVFVLIWTTTPWTLPANVGMAFHPQLEYCAVKTEHGVYVCATSRVPSLKDKLGWEQCQILAHFGAGKKIPFDEALHPFLPDRKVKLILADYVSAEDGTGVVHIAPGHGEDDYFYGHIKNQLPVLCPVDEKGRFTEEFPLCSGMHVFKANEVIVQHLKEKNRLLHSEDYRHAYPYSSRGHVPIIFRATQQWFLKMDHEDLRGRVLNAVNQTVRFHPDWGRNRFAGTVEHRPDWCLSRQRFWGVPIPVIRHKETDQFWVGQTRKKIVEEFRRCGADVWYEKEAAFFLKEGSGCVDPENLVKETDILDVWFDSGVSHECVLRQRPELKDRADLYLEGSDQHRGWFQVSLITSMALKNQAPYDAILTHGFVVDGEGKKMSKSKGNVISPAEVADQMGADVLRLWVSSCDYQFDVRMSKEILSRTVEAYRRIRNTFRYLLGNCGDFNPEKDTVPFSDMTSLDRWAVSKWMRLLKQVTELYDRFEFCHIYRLVHDFCTLSLSNFYLDVLKDRMYCDPVNGRERRSSQTAFWIMLSGLAKIMAPILPFTCEEVWNASWLNRESPSVHTASWPQYDAEKTDDAAFEKWEGIQKIRNAVNARIEKFRESGHIGSAMEAQVRLGTDHPGLRGFLEKHLKDLSFACIISDAKIMTGNFAGAEPVDWLDGESPSLAVEVLKADGRKCERCWNFRGSVGQHSLHPTLCTRCFEAVPSQAGKV